MRDGGGGRDRSVKSPPSALRFVDKGAGVGDGDQGKGFGGTGRGFKGDGSDGCGVAGGDGDSVDREKVGGAEDGTEVAGVELRGVSGFYARRRCLVGGTRGVEDLQCHRA